MLGLQWTLLGLVTTLFPNIERRSRMIETQADVVVIGGGIVGCATAYYLAKRDVAVVLVEKGEIGSEQSSRNWGFVRQQRRDPAEMPMMVEANRIWQGLEDELDADIEWVQGGVLAAAGDEDTLARFRDWIRVSDDYGVETRLLTRNDIQTMVPHMTGQYIGGIFTPSDGHAEPLKATMAFADAAERKGARILTYHIAEGIETTAGRVSAVMTDRGAIRTPVVINAAGAFGAKIARMAGLRLPTLLVRSTVAETTPMEPVTAAGVWAPHVSFRQKRDGRIYIARGGLSDYDMTLDSLLYAREFLPNYLKNRQMFRVRLGKPLVNDVAARLPRSAERQHPFAATVGVEPQPNYDSARRSLRALADLMPAAAELRIRRTWAGMIDSTPDAVPVIGEVGRPRGFIFATGFSGHGFAMGPIVGRLLAELIVDGKPSIDIDHLSYSRFPEGRIGKAKHAV
jgi:glycine/D-amino acid oxidase-like deaminating enzyme